MYCPSGSSKGGGCFQNMWFHAPVVPVRYTWDPLHLLNNTTQTSTKLGNSRDPETRGNNTLALSKKISRPVEHFQQNFVESTRSKSEWTNIILVQKLLRSMFSFMSNTESFFFSDGKQRNQKTNEM